MVLGRNMFPALFVVLLGRSARRRTSARSSPPPIRRWASTTPGLRWCGVRMTTSLGNIELELDRERAPISVANFLFYAERGEYDGTIFHRVVENFVIQGGGYTRDFKELASAGTIPERVAERAEERAWNDRDGARRGTEHGDAGILHQRGGQSEARWAATYDGERRYAVFGRVVDGWTWWTGSGSCRWRRRPDPKGSGDRRTTWRTCRWSRRWILKVEQAK